jgi:DNA repair exonuclease SbcCD ATPase subunit
MFKAIGRWIKAVGYLLTGQIDSARRVLDTNPHVIKAKYDAIVEDKIERIHQYKQAVAGLIAQEEKKLSKIKQLTSEVENLERLKAGALAKAKQTVEQLKATGVSEEAIHEDENYKKCLTAYKDFNSTLSEKQERISELEADIEGYKNNISDHKIQLQQLLRDVEKVKAEAADTVADVITAKQEKELAETFAGIAKDGTAEELQNLREMRQELKAEAKITKELAGTDTKSQEAEFLEYARQGESTSEFDALIGLASEAPAPKETNKEKEDKDSSALPE